MLEETSRKVKKAAKLRDNDLVRLMLRVESRQKFYDAFYDAESSTGRQQALLDLGVSIVSGDTTISIYVNGQAKVEMRDLAPKSRVPGFAGDKPDGSAPSKFDDPAEEYEAQALEKIGILASEEAEVDSMLAELSNYAYSVPPDETNCVASGPSAEGRPDYCEAEFLKAFAVGTLAKNIYGASLASANDLIANFRTLVGSTRAQFALGILTAAQLEVTIGAAGVALLASMDIPFYVALGAAAYVAYEVGQFVWCLCINASPEAIFQPAPRLNIFRYSSRP